jgi:shikimate kinase
MRGVSRSSAALTVVNALPTGVGCAIGIARFVTVTAELEPGNPETVQCTPEDAGTPLVRASVLAALARVDPTRRLHAVLDLRSEIPVAKGLKSSSAVSTATILAVTRAAGRELTSLAVAQLAAKVGRSVGVSATGALDDALAGLRPGFVVTDNRRDTLLAEGAPDPSWAAVVYLPPGQHPPAPSLRTQFETAAVEGLEAVHAALAGRYPEAMRCNTLLVERLMGYRYAELRERIEKAGAVGVGVSGLGPALAALVPRDRQEAVLSCLPSDSGERFTADLTREVGP